MSRRMDREGVYRMMPQGIVNKLHNDDPRCVPDANGWIQPFSALQGWDEFNHAVYALQRAMIWRSFPVRLNADGKIDRSAEMNRLRTIADDLNRCRWYLKRSAGCDRPVLP